MTRRKWVVMASVVTAAVGIAAGVFTQLPRLLTEDETPIKADVVVVLGGDASGARVQRGVELYATGYAPVVVMSGGPIYRLTTWAELMRLQALDLEVPANKILIQDRSWTTAEDAKFTSAMLYERGVKSAIVVTSSWHSARAIKLFRSAEPRINWISCPCAQEWTGSWWRDPGIARAMAAEVLKVIWPDRP